VTTAALDVLPPTLPLRFCSCLGRLATGETFIADLTLLIASAHREDGGGDGTSGPPRQRGQPALGLV